MTTFAAPARATRETDLATWAGLFAAATLLMGVGTPPVPIVAALFARGPDG